MSANDNHNISHDMDFDNMLFYMGIILLRGLCMIVFRDSEMENVRKEIACAVTYLLLAHSHIKKAYYRLQRIKHSNSFHDKTLMMNIRTDCERAMRKCGTMIEHLSAQKNILLDSEFVEQEDKE